MSGVVERLRAADRARRRWYSRLATMGRLEVTQDVVVGGAPRIVRGASLRLASRTGLGPGCLCMAEVVVGEDCLISADVKFIGDDHPVHGSGRLNESPSNFPQRITIGDDVLVGCGATVIGPASVGSGAVIAAGAVVKGDVAPRAIVGGVPARVIGERGNA